MGGTLLSLSANDAVEKMTHTAHDVPNTGMEVLGENQRRRFAMLMNDSNVVMYISLGVPAQPHNGIRLERNGGAIQFTHCTGNLYSGKVYAIHEGSQSARLMVTEGQ